MINDVDAEFNCGLCVERNEISGKQKLSKLGCGVRATQVPPPTMRASVTVTPEFMSAQRYKL